MFRFVNTRWQYVLVYRKGHGLVKLGSRGTFSSEPRTLQARVLGHSAVSTNNESPHPSKSLSVPDTLESPPAGPAGAHLPAAPDLAGQAGPELENMAQPKSDCRSPVGLDCCNCCLDLAHRSGLQRDNGGDNNNSGSPTVSNFRQLQEKLVFENLNTDKLNSIMRQDSLEPVLRDPCYLINEGICNRNIDQTMLSILLFFHRHIQLQLKEYFREGRGLAKGADSRHDKDQVTLFFSGSKEWATPGLEGSIHPSPAALHLAMGEPTDRLPWTTESPLDAE
ncbi:hypothetical protein MJG53_020184 [Ovis ammon polii x Ovis aries]|uniref:Uncharacterized protein n=1 Tax=Ovis ammon polii x Ovis aries TaxID=2918886 RepID=A0ACB9U1P2_9CETA|nr:hypothetical protein MJG53_020184 [Ovis ammon polii x Ovis aries]